MFLGTFHLGFHKYFNWKVELELVSLINRQMMIVHTLFIGLIVFLIGVLCFFHSSELLSSELGHTLSIGLALFWTLRLLVQLFGYSSKLWKGKAFETGIHILFLFLWTYLSSIFWIISLSS